MSSTTKTLVFTEHANERMHSRRIHPNQVACAIRSPSRTLAGNEDYTLRLERDFPENRSLVVIVEEDDEMIKVITVYWS